jgi:DNA-binding transcriptional MerR regulator
VSNCGMGSSERDDAMRIGELSRRTGVSAHVLRSWERRYGLLSPERTPGGFRLYSEADERRIRAMQAHIAEGYSPSAAARLVARETADAPAVDTEPAPEQAAEAPLASGLAEEQQALRRALVGMDEVAATEQLDRIFGRYGLVTAVDDILIPYLVDLGDRWVRGESTISEEHFATFVIRGRLMSLARGWGSGHGPMALLACAPDEDHDLGLISFGLGLRHQGWRILMLGANTPIETVEASAAAMRPDLVVVTSTRRERLTTLTEGLRAIGARHRLLLGGGGADAALARKVGAEVGEGPPMRAAAALTPPSVVPSGDESG